MSRDLGRVPDPASNLTAGTTRRENGTTVTHRTFFLALPGETLDEITGYWNGLAEGASILEPLAASSWSPGFGMLTDRFGVAWVVDVQDATPQT